MNTSQKLTKDSIVSVTPVDGWEVVCSADGEELWTEPVIGWATYVSWSGCDSDGVSEGEEDQIQTSVSPLVLHDGARPTLLREMGQPGFFSGRVSLVVRRTAEVAR